MENLSALSPSLDNKKISHHGEYVKNVLEENRISRADFQQLIGKSHGWLHDLFNTERFNTQQIALVSMALGLDPSEFGFTTSLRVHNEFTLMNNCNNNYTYEIKIAMNNLSDKYQKLESHILFLQELLADTSKVINQQSRMLEKKDDLIYSSLLNHKISN